MNESSVTKYWPLHVNNKRSIYKLGLPWVFFLQFFPCSDACSMPICWSFLWHLSMYQTDIDTLFLDHLSLKKTTFFFYSPLSCLALNCTWPQFLHLWGEVNLTVFESSWDLKTIYMVMLLQVCGGKAVDKAGDMDQSAVRTSTPNARLPLTLGFC